MRFVWAILLAEVAPEHQPAHQPAHTKAEVYCTERAPLMSS